MYLSRDGLGRRQHGLNTATLRRKALYRDDAWADILLQLSQIGHDFGNSFPQIPRCHEVKGSRVQRFDDLLDLIEDIGQVEAESEVINAAVAIAFEL